MTNERTTSESSRGAHRIACLAQCPFLYGIKYLLRLELKELKDSLARGTCNHVGLEAYYLGEDPFGAIMGVDAKHAHMAVVAANVIQAYTKRYPISVTPVGIYEELGRVVFVEKEFELDIGGQLLTRRLDTGMIDKKNRLFIMDHKTAARPSQRKRRTSLDPTLFTQDIVGREVVASQFNAKWGGVILNMLPVDPRKTEGFQRQKLVYTQELINSQKPSLLYWLEQDEMLTKAYERGELDPWGLARSFNCYPHGYSCDCRFLCSEGKMALNRYEGRDE